MSQGFINEYTGDNPVFKTITFDPNTGGIVGTSELNNAAIGIVGEFQEQEAGDNVTSEVPKQIAAIALTAGDWEISGSATFLPTGGATMTAVTAKIDDLSAATVTDSFLMQVSQTAAGTFALPQRRFLINASKTFYITAQANFSSGSVEIDAKISARRIR